jgi:hypothetical protein
MMHDGAQNARWEIWRFLADLTGQFNVVNESLTENELMTQRKYFAIVL